MSNIIKGLEFGELSEKSELAQEPSNDSAVIDVVGYGKMSVDTLKHYIKDYSNKLNALVQNEEFLKALEQAMSSNYKKQFIYPLGALAHATKSGLHEEDIEEGYRAGVVGGAGLGIEKSPMEKVLEKPLGDLDEHIGSPGGMGQSYRKFKPKASGMMEEYSDLEDRRKAIQDLQMDPDTSKDPMLRKEVIRLKNELNKAEQLEKLKKMNKGNGRPQPRIATEGLDKAKIHAEYKEIKKELTQMARGRTDTPIKLKRRQELQTRLKELMSILQSKEGVSEGKNKGKEDYDRIKELKSKTNAQLQSLLDFWKKSLEEEPVTPMDHHVVKRAKEQIPLIKSIMAERIGKKGVEEGFTHDPRGTTGIPHTDKFGIRSRGVNLPVADTKDFKRYSNYEKWSRDIERVNSLLLDDRADFKSDQNGVHVTMNGKRIAAWSHRNKNGDIDIRAAKEYNQGITEGALKDIEGQLKKHEQKRIDREKAGDPYVAHEIVSHDLIHKQLLDKRNQIMRKNQKRAVDENSMVKEVTIKDLKTGKEYDPKAEFEKLQNDPEYIDQMKRMSKKDASNLHVNDRVVISGNVNFQGEKGNIESFGRQKAFVIVHLDNYGSHSFHSSDVSYLDDQDEYQEESSIMKGLRR